MLIENDKLPEDNIFFYTLIILSIIGTFDITSEILEHTGNIFSSNIVKKIILWSIVYLKTKSVFYSSLISICIILALPKIFFGKKTGPRVDKEVKKKIFTI